MKQAYKFYKDTMSLLMFIHQLNKKMIFTCCLKSLISALLPYVYIVGGAHIIDLLIQTEYDEAILYSIGMVVLYFIIHCLHGYLVHVKEIDSMEINRVCNASILMKSIQLDFATFEDKKNLEEFSAADYNTARQGGFGSFLISFEKLFEGMISMVISFIFVIELCVSIPTSKAAYASLINVGSSIALIGAIIILLFISYLKVIKYVNTNNMRIFNESIEVNQKYNYFGDQLFMNEVVAKDIRVYHMQEFIFHKWKKLTYESFVFRIKETQFTTNSLLSYSVLNDIVLFVSYLFVSLKAIVGAITIGSFTQYIGVFRQFNLALKNFVEALGDIQIKNSYLTYYISYVNKKNTLNTGTKKIEEMSNHEIEFHHVSFKYPGSDVYVLKDVSCKLNSQEKVAIVGRNGAGKTTFIKLLCRLYEVSEGKITLNGIDVRDYDYDDYLNHFGVVFQDFALFSMSIKENIGGVNCTDDELVWDCLNKVGMTDKVKSYENGFDTLMYNRMGEGVDMSGGQAQKIAIARALYKDAPFMILDEPTAALDPISEYEIYEQFNAMVKDKLSIYISHRMSSCRFCDRIFVFDDGLLVQRGSHDALIEESNSVYANLWNAQAKYYNS